MACCERVQTCVIFTDWNPAGWLQPDQAFRHRHRPSRAQSPWQETAPLMPRVRRNYHHHPLKPRVDRLPTVPGVYLMRNDAGEILYVGKALNLRARVRSYFNGTDTRPRMHRLMRELTQLEVNLTRDEREALLLEARLIRQHQPRYNIALKSGARMMSVRIDLRHPFPRLDIGEMEQDGARWFGPLSSTWRTAQVVELLERYYQIRTCSDRELARMSRPCLQYQLRRCPAPCAGYIQQEAYAERIQAVMDVMQGGQAALIQSLHLEMRQAAERLEFEQAAWIRDRIAALQGMHRKPAQPVDGPDRDVWGLARLADEVSVSLLPVRFGRQQQTSTWYLESVLETNDEVLTNLLLQHYELGPEIPASIHLPYELPERDTLAEILTERAGRPVLLNAESDCAGLDTIARAAADAELTGARAEDDRLGRGLQDLGQRLKFPQPVLSVEWLKLDLSDAMAWRVRLQATPVTPQNGPVSGPRVPTSASRSNGSRARTYIHKSSTTTEQNSISTQSTTEKKKRARKGSAPKESTTATPLVSVTWSHKQHRIRTLPLHDLEATLERLLPRLYGDATSSSRPDLLMVEGGHSLLKAMRRGLDALGIAMEVVGLPTEPPVLITGLLMPGRRNVLPMPVHAPARHVLEQVREAGLKLAGGQADDAERDPESLVTSPSAPPLSDDD